MPRQMPTPISGSALGSFGFILPGRILTADPGTYVLTGSDLALVRHGVAAGPHRQMPTPISGSALGSFAFIPPGRALILAADAGSYALTGTAANLKVGRRLKAWTDVITNGDFSAGTSGWTVSGVDTTLTAAVGGATLTLGPAASGGYVYQAVAVTPGQRYTLRSLIVTEITTGAGFRIGTTQGAVDLGSVTVAPGAISFQSKVFTGPPGGVVYVSLFLSVDHDGSGHFGWVRTEATGNYLLTGSPVTLTKTERLLSAAGGSYALTGLDVVLRVGRKITLDPGVYIQTRATAQLRIGRMISAAPGSYAITASDASFTVITGRYIHAERGAYALAGSDVRLLVGRRLPMAGGTYALTGADISGVYRRIIKAAPGTYALTGAALGLRVGYRVAAAPGSYVLTGADADLVNRRLTAASGSYAIAGADARLLAGRLLAAAPGVYTVTGSATALLLGHRLVAAAGSYVLSPTNVTLRVGRRLVAASGVYVINGAVARVARDFVIHATPGVYTLSGTALRPIVTRRMSLAGGVYRLTWQDVGLVPTWRARGPRAIAVGFAASRYLAVSSQNRRVVAGRQDRRIPVEPAARRYAAVEPRDKEPEGGSMLQWPEKDPNEVLDYELDWADPDDPRLETGETLLTSVWSVTLGDVVINVGLTTFTPQGLSTVWLTGGTAATKCELLNRVTTSMGRTYDKTVVLRVRDH